MTKNQKYFFLYLKTGGGHLAPARSVTTFLKSKYPGLAEPVLIDGLQEAPAAIRYSLEDGYRHLQSYARWFYALLYFFNKWSFIARLNALTVSAFVKPYLERQILASPPEKIIIFHFFLIKPVADILKKHSLEIPTLVVVTDPFTAHPLWFLDREQRFIVFSERLRESCVRNGISGGNISVFPFILNEKFSEQQPCELRESVKTRLGFDCAKKLILVVGGADGIPKGKKIVQQLLKQNPDTEVAVICGNNERLLKKILALKHDASPGQLSVYGFVDSVYDFLQISDIVVTKCGASMFMETLFSRKIPIVNNYLWEQEKGNVDFLQQHHMGIYEKDTRKLSSWINKLFSDTHLYGSFRKSIEEAGFVNGVGPVSEYIVRFKAA